MHSFPRRLLTVVAVAAFIAAPGSLALGQTADGKKPDEKTTEKKDDGSAFKADGKVAILGGLEKPTARIRTFEGKVGKVVKFGTLEIMVRRCQRTPPDERPERAAFLEIYDTHVPEGAKPQRRKVFSGWMFASNPALSALEHSIYDIWVKDCK
jgi:hypothetical protein